jgi:hypothetical protein
MKRLDKIKNIDLANKKLLREFDIDSHQETSDNGYNRLAEYLQPLVDQELIHSDIRDEILDLASSYADDMWREGAQGGFAPK